jgi:hypothetical protein
VNVSILLLDCSKNLEEKLKRQGFDVASGSVGYVSGTQQLPGPVYEYDVIIYNPTGTFPSAFNSGDVLERNYQLSVLREQNAANVEPLWSHVQSGAIVLIFINDLPDGFDFLNTAYSWVPNMPQIAATQDFKPCILEPEHLAANQTFADAIGELSPLLTIDDLKRPVRQKIVLNTVFDNAAPLFINRQWDYLGLSLKAGRGRIIALPQYVDNEYVISNFLNRVLPRLYTGPTRRDIVDVFVSPIEQAAKQEIQSVESERQTLDERLEKAKEQLAFGERSKRKTIESDETAARIISYYKTATQQEDVALFYLYKIIDALENKFGGATAAKQTLGNDADWRLIGKIANASYGDIRHAPKPGEKIKEWTKEEIDECFGAAERILKAYFTSLFSEA